MSHVHARENESLLRQVVVIVSQVPAHFTANGMGVKDKMQARTLNEGLEPKKSNGNVTITIIFL